MADDNVSHEDVVSAVRKALVEAARQAYNSPSNYAHTALQLAQAYEHIMNAGSEY